ncbi:hypothetical protein C8R44DRAFT_830241 [Mycena epipterygia]|nr:hypothetical protein C8R44DRAFT_830241 [Mycena epipterygia]
MRLWGDYIVVREPPASGLTGMTVAARLAENPSITVLLIEASQDDNTNPEVYNIYDYSQAFVGPLDWAWTAEQGKVIHGGKTLGGSSSINGGHWTRGLNAQYDTYPNICDTYQTVFPPQAETFSAPNAQQAAKGTQLIASYHGTSGPLQVTYPDAMYSGPQQPAFVDTIVNLTGMSHFKDLSGGMPNCVSITPVSIDWHRSDYCSSSVEAYLTPVESQRTNWVTLAWHIVCSCNWSNPGSIPLAGSGVEYAYWTNSTTRYAVYVRCEVIVAAGTIQTPALLQLSDIGNSSILRPLGITTQIDLKKSGNGFDVGGEGPDAIVYLNIYQLFGSQASAKVSQIQGNLSAWATSQAGSALSTTALQQIYQVQANLIINNNTPVVELFYDTGFPDCGSVKITSTDPFIYPTIKVNYFSVGIDLDMQVAGARLARRIITSPPLSSLSTGETIPGNAVPDNADRGFASVAHPIGTAAMMRRALAGVVDAQLKVYDTANVRVVDASIMPLQVSAHLSTTLYGVVEKAANLIKAAQ